jgi:hypothetical protein
MQFRFRWLPLWRGRESVPGPRSERGGRESAAAPAGWGIFRMGAEEEPGEPAGMSAGADLIDADDDPEGAAMLLQRRCGAVEPGAGTGRDEEDARLDAARLAAGQKLRQALASVSAAGDGADDLIEGGPGCAGHACLPVGGEQEILAERTVFEQGAGNAGGGLVGGPGDEIRQRARAWRQGALGSANDHLAGAGVVLPQHRLERVARAVGARFEVIADRLALGVAHRIAGDQLLQQALFGNATGVRRDADARRHNLPQGDGRQSEDVGDADAADDLVLQAPRTVARTRSTRAAPLPTSSASTPRGCSQATVILTRGLR